MSKGWPRGKWKPRGHHSNILMRSSSVPDFESNEMFGWMFVIIFLLTGEIGFSTVNMTPAESAFVLSNAIVNWPLRWTDFRFYVLSVQHGKHSLSHWCWTERAFWYLKGTQTPWWPLSVVPWLFTKLWKELSFLCIHPPIPLPTSPPPFPLPQCKPHTYHTLHVTQRTVFSFCSQHQYLRQSLQA